MKILKNIKHFIKGWYCKNFYSIQRLLTEFNGVCDICNKPVGFSDYGYMCREHGDIYYKTSWKFYPKFLFRLYQIKIRLKRNHLIKDGKLDDRFGYLLEIETYKIIFKIGFIPHVIYQYKVLREKRSFLDAIKGTIYGACDVKEKGFYHYRILSFAWGWKIK
jgi:hypothetical protein